MEETPATGWPALLMAAGARHGALHLRRCSEFGLRPAVVRHRARQEQWDKPYPSVFLLPGSVDGWWRTASARLEAVGSDAALGLRAAAYAHGLTSDSPTLTEIARRSGKHVPRLRLVKVHTYRTLTESDIAIVDGLRCTTPHRTMRDLAHVLDVEPLRAHGIEGLRVGTLDLVLLGAELDRMRAGPAHRRLAAVVRQLGSTRTESPFAYEVIEAIAELGLQIEGEYPWRCPDGRIIHLDGAIPAAWVAVECDGRGKYASGTSFTTDRIRWTQTSGRWRTVWVSWDRWQQHRDAVLADVRRAVTGADPAVPPPERADCRCKRCRSWQRQVSSRTEVAPALGAPTEVAPALGAPTGAAPALGGPGPG